MIKKFKDLQVGDRLIMSDSSGKFHKIQIMKKTDSKTHFGYVHELPFYEKFWIPYPTVTAPPDKFVAVYSQAR